MGFELVDGRYPENSDEVVVGQYFAYNFTDTLMPDGRNYVSRYVWDENGNIDTEMFPTRFSTRSRRASPWYSHRMTTVRAPNYPL